MTSKRERPILRGREVSDTGIPCPLCAKEGRTTVGGYTPQLRRLADDSDGRVFCLGTHGYVSDEEMI